MNKYYSSIAKITISIVVKMEIINTLRIITKINHRKIFELVFSWAKPTYKAILVEIFYVI